MSYVYTVIATAIVSVVLTLIFRVRVENALKAEKAALLAAAKRAQGQ